MKGYQNKVAGYRNDGVLSSREGVDAISCDAYTVANELLLFDIIVIVPNVP